MSISSFYYIAHFSFTVFLLSWPLRPLSWPRTSFHVYYGKTKVVIWVRTWESPFWNFTNLCKANSKRRGGWTGRKWGVMVQCVCCICSTTHTTDQWALMMTQEVSLYKRPLVQEGAGGSQSALAFSTQVRPENHNSYPLMFCFYLWEVLNWW